MVEKGVQTTDTAKTCHFSAILATNWLALKLSDVRFKELGVRFPM